MATHGTAGFSLIEALVAMAILAVSAISLLSATQAHVARIGGLEARALAQIVAENRLAEIEINAVEDEAPAILLGQIFEISVDRVPTADPDLERLDLSVTDVAREETWSGFLGFLARGSAP